MTTASPRTSVVAYLRVSTDKQAEEGISLDAQRAKVLAYAQLYDLDVVSVEVDAGVSAKTLDRPALDRALASLRTGRAAALLVVKLDRLTRSVHDLGELVERYFAGSRWALLSVSEQIDTRSAAGRLVLNVLASVAQWEREATGERTSAAMAHKRSLREFTGGQAPYGWRLAADAVHLEPEPVEQEVIRLAGDLRSTGLTLRQVGAQLSSLGRHPRSGREWHAKTVRSLINAKEAA